ncbi:hypothetical protein L2E82_44538 [Cichorium intybus]|uniref:Uncharacterized protein n=1 Tax=Cichorium intybus TaxID=13427 RepID=A0ACB8ZRE6_CICIN|nr:hypothetical protein L2E82_44538 [Cichorium intybus]
MIGNEYDSNSDEEYVLDDDRVHEDTEVDMDEFYSVVYPTVEEPINMDTNEMDEADIDIIYIDQFINFGEAITDREALLRYIRIRKACSEQVFHDPDFHVGEKFEDIAHVKDAITNLAIETRRDLQVVKNDGVRIRCVCRDKVPQENLGRPAGNLNAMHHMALINKQAHDWLKSIPTKHWSRSHFSGRANSDMLLNNLCEVFNGNIVDGRDRPIISALEFIREYIMKNIVTVQHLIERSEGTLTPITHAIMENVKEAASQCSCVYSGNGKCQVSRDHMEQFVLYGTWLTMENKLACLRKKDQGQRMRETAKGNAKEPKVRQIHVSCQGSISELPISSVTTKVTTQEPERANGGIDNMEAVLGGVEEVKFEM